jgi:predicted benzoate:H+ symporter BenE
MESVVGILILAFVVWCLLQLFTTQPARTIILVVGIVVALVGGVWLHVGHTVIVR